MRAQERVGRARNPNGEILSMHHGVFRVLAIVLALPVWVAAGASSRAEDFIGYFYGTWAGLPGADIRVQFSQDGSAYRDRLCIETKGLPRWLTHFRFDGISEGQVTDGGDSSPSRFDVNYDIENRRNARISLQFLDGERGVVAERTHADSTRKPPLPEVYRRNVIDPITAIGIVRQKLRLATERQGLTFDFPAFDGARRFEVTGGVVSVGGPDHLISLAFTLTPIAGFHSEATDDPNPDDTPRPVEVTFTDDARLLPVSFRVPVVYLPFVARFGHTCKSFDTCDEDGG